MGTVGFIEERGELNLGFGIPAGSAIILAAAGSLHTTKGFGGYKTSTCPPNSPLRFLGPTLQIAVPLTIIWGTACSFLVALFVKSLKTLTINPIMKPNYDDEDPNYLCHKRDLTILASLKASLCFVVIISIITLLRIDCKYDPD
nr:uncharacterized protein LOC111421536 [Onthophagus taurus]